MELLEIVEWDKYNPRKDVSNPTWFRLENKTFFDPEWDEFDGQEIAVWHYLLSFASFKKKHIFEFDLNQISKRARVPRIKAESAIQKLIEKQSVTVTSKARNEDVTPTSRERNEDVSLQYSTEQDITKHNITGHDTEFHSQLLLDLWNANCGPLPKAKSSEARLKKAKAQIKKYPDPEHWLTVIKKFTSSKFCLENWKPGFDALLDENKRLGAIEGKYDDRKPPDSFSQRRQASNLDLLKKVEEGLI